MSSLWTPGGEHPVDPKTGEHQPSEEPQSASVPDLESLSPEEQSQAGEHQPSEEPQSASVPDLESLSPEEQSQAEALAREMATVREQLASTPAALVVANHLMGLYELAAIHLSQQPANMGEASVAIDALGAVVEALPDRLGEAEATLRDALHQIRLAYVQVGQQADDGPGETEPDND